MAAEAALSDHVKLALAAEAAACWPAEGEGDCRICLERAPLAALLAPCACAGSMRYAHRECLARWCEQRSSARCEVCAQQYADAELLSRLRRHPAEPPARATPSADARLLVRAPRAIAAHAARRLLLLGLVVVTVSLLFLTQAAGGGHTLGALAPRELDAALEKTARWALPVRSRLLGAAGETRAEGFDRSPQPEGLRKPRGGSAAEGGHVIQAEEVVPPSLMSIARKEEIKILDAATKEGCWEDMALVKQPVCKRGELVLRLLRRRRAIIRDQRADDAAGEAMGRMARALVMLCVLRLVIVHQQRHRRLASIEASRLPLPV
ncbi:hypothetical protein AB1Y20_006165 [Prymnesium parvum]|uniref:RING-CH-type domain-containing protein n=1 Tax=Prymnesium parvum TaxID=97485 RepID=A0AB34J127_PRYPA